MCISKLECLVYEIFFIELKNLTLSIQSDFLKGQLKCKTKTSKQTIYSNLNTKFYFLIIFALSLTKLLPSLWLLDTPGFRHFVFLLPFSKRG